MKAGIGAKILLRCLDFPTESQTQYVLPHEMKHLPVERQTSGWVGCATISLGGRYLCLYSNSLQEFE
jgi:hypothetical protein